MPEKKLELVHLQLTRQCNLRCRFCGQWGTKGFFSGCLGDGLSLAEWKRVADSLDRYSYAAEKRPSVILWGGEPLVYSEFENIVKYLRAYGFELAIITNGVLLNKYSELIKNEFRSVYVSIDGPREIHDSIRGKGVFEKVIENINLLKGGNAKIIFMTTICPENIKILPDLPDLFDDCGPDKMLFNELIHFDLREIAEYKNWLHSRFGINADKIDSWHMDLPSGYEAYKKEQLKKLFQRLNSLPPKTPVEYLPHGIVIGGQHCLSPFRHLHVAWNGSVLFCTDFYDFSAGNVCKENVIDIWNGKLVEKFRREIIQGNCPACNHCSWKSNRNYKLD